MLPNYSKEEIMNLDLGLTGKTAIITGGAAGIGNMTAAYLLRRERSPGGYESKDSGDREGDGSGENHWSDRKHL